MELKPNLEQNQGASAKVLEGRQRLLTVVQSLTLLPFLAHS